MASEQEDIPNVLNNESPNALRLIISTRTTW
jgi:hypothetical protein